METLNPKIEDLEEIIRYALIYKGISKSVTLAAFENKRVDPSILLVESGRVFFESLCQSIIREFLYKHPSVYTDISSCGFFLISLYQVNYRLIYSKEIRGGSYSSTEKIYAYRDLKNSLSHFFSEHEIVSMLDS